jgi:hypothetical protein
MELGLFVNDVLSVLWQLLFTSLGLVAALNTIIFTGFISLPFIGTISLSTLLFNPVSFVGVFIAIVKKKLI